MQSNLSADMFGLGFPLIRASEDMSGGHSHRSLFTTDDDVIGRGRSESEDKCDSEAGDLFDGDRGYGTSSKAGHSSR